MYQSLIIFLFGESLFILKLFNVVYSVGITIFIYKIATRLFHESIGRISGIVYALFIPSIVMCSVLTNQHIATFFSFLAFISLLNIGRRTAHLYGFGVVYLLDLEILCAQLVV